MNIAKSFASFILVLMFANFCFAITYINSCQMLDIENEEYHLTEDVRSDMNCFEIVASGITLDCNGHSITSNFFYSGDGIYIYSQDRIKIKNCNISSWSNGIFISVGNNHELRNNRVSGNNQGIFISEGSESTFIGNIVESNEFNGFHISASQNNIFTSNTVNSNSNGFYLESSPDNTFDLNIAESNEYTGFIFSSSHNNTLTSNTAKSNSNNGFKLGFSHNNTLTSNTAESNGDNGFFFLNGNDNSLASNTAESNKNTGFTLTQSSYNTLTSNKANSNTFDGFSLNSSSNNNILTSNLAESNGDRGFQISLSSNYNELSENIAANNYHGFTIFYSSNNNLNGNTATGNHHFGFEIQRSSSMSLDRNRAESNAGAGFLLEDSVKDIVLTNNIAQSNQQPGIYIWDVASSTFTNNQLILNGGEQILIEAPCTGILFVNNTLQGGMWVVGGDTGTRFDSGEDNANSLGFEGNRYYFADGTPSWEVYDIQDGTPQNNWADAGADRPFDEHLLEWESGSRDWHPYTETVELTCEDSSVPACAGICTNPAKACTDALENGKDCSCQCPQAERWMAKIPDTKTLANGLGLQLADISPATGDSDTHPAVIDFIGTDGKKSENAAVQVGDVYTFVELSTGKSLTIKVVQTDPGVDLSSKWAFILVYPPCPNAGEAFNETACVCECNPTLKQECLDNEGSWDEKTCACFEKEEFNCTGKTSQTHDYINNFDICTNDCPSYKICQEKTCTCQCDQKKKADCTWPNKWHEDTCTCEGVQYCESDSTLACNIACQNQKKECTLQDDSCQCICDSDITCKEPKQFDADICGCICKQDSTAKLYLDGIASNADYNLKVVGISSSLGASGSNIEVIGKDGKSQWIYKNIAPGDYTHFINKETGKSISFIISKINAAEGWVEIYIYPDCQEPKYYNMYSCACLCPAFLKDACKEPKEFNEATCVCECDQEKKTDCISKNGEWNDETCSCTNTYCGEGEDAGVCTEDCENTKHICTKENDACKCQCPEVKTCDEGWYWDKELCQCVQSCYYGGGYACGGACENTDMGCYIYPNIDGKNNYGLNKDCFCECGPILSSRQNMWSHFEDGNSLSLKQVNSDGSAVVATASPGYLFVEETAVREGTSFMSKDPKTNKTTSYKIMKIISQNGEQIIVYSQLGVCPDGKIIDPLTCACKCDPNAEFNCIKLGLGFDEQNCKCTAEQMPNWPDKKTCTISGGLTILGVEIIPPASSGCDNGYYCNPNTLMCTKNKVIDQKPLGVGFKYWWE